MMRAKAVSVVMTSVATDQRKPVVLGLDSEIDRGADGSWTDSATASVTFKATPSLTVEAGPRLMRSFNVAQYVTARQDPSAAGTYGARYVFGELDQTEIAMATRVSWVLSPRTSLQIYAQPLLSTGRYGTFKEAARPRTFSFNRYGVDAGSIAFDAASGRYTVTPAPGASSFSFDNPDFNVKSLRVNGVFRWEFRPGSTLFVVWTQQREDGARPGRFALGPDLSSLASAPADNVLMVKVSYWFTR